MLKNYKKVLLLVSVVCIAIALAITVLSGLSHTRDYYACHQCKSLGKSKALRVLGFPIFREQIEVTRSLTGKTCKHEWQFYFTNSQGILFNRENWDGPLGNYPWQKLTQEMENKRMESIVPIGGNPHP